MWPNLPHINNCQYGNQPHILMHFCSIIGAILGVSQFGFESWQQWSWYRLTSGPFTHIFKGPGIVLTSIAYHTSSWRKRKHSVALAQARILQVLLVNKLLCKLFCTVIKSKQKLFVKCLQNKNNNNNLQASPRPRCLRWKCAMLLSQIFFAPKRSEIELVSQFWRLSWTWLTRTPRWPHWPLAKWSKLYKIWWRICPRPR